MEATVQCRETWNVTDKSDLWIQPSDVKIENSDMGHRAHYTTVDAAQQSLNGLSDSETDNKLDLRTGARKITTLSPTHLDLTRFYADLHKAGGKSVILSVLPCYCEEFRDPEADVTEDQSEGIEKRTRKRQKSSFCFSAQDDGVAASKVQAVYATDLSAYEVAEVFHDHDYFKNPLAVTAAVQWSGRKQLSGRQVSF